MSLTATALESPSATAASRGLSPPLTTTTQSLTRGNVSDITSSRAVTSAEWPITQPDEHSPASTTIHCTTHVDSSLLMPCHPKHTSSNGSYWETTVDCCGCTLPHVTIQALSLDPSTYGEVRILSFGSRPSSSLSLPNPYTNTFRMDTVCTVAALHAAANHLGATEETICAEESPSPFFRSGAAQSTDETVRSNIVGTVQRLWGNVETGLEAE